MVGWLWWTLSTLSVAARVSIRSPGSFASAPADWWILVSVAPREEHRLLVVEAIGEPGEYRRSDYTLEGERAAKMRQVYYRVLPEGCYRFRARVYGHGRELGAATSPLLRVIGLAGNLCPES